VANVSRKSVEHDGQYAEPVEALGQQVAAQAKQRQGTRTDLGNNIPQNSAECCETRKQLAERATSLLKRPLAKNGGRVDRCTTDGATQPDMRPDESDWRAAL